MTRTTNDIVGKTVLVTRFETPFRYGSDRYSTHVECVARLVWGGEVGIGGREKDGSLRKRIATGRPGGFLRIGRSLLLSQQRGRDRFVL